MKLSAFIFLLAFALTPFAFGAEANEVTLKVEGMHCQVCVAGVKKALDEVEGVESAEVTLEPGQAVVKVEEGKVKDETLIAAVKKAGFKAEVEKEEKEE